MPIFLLTLNKNEYVVQYYKINQALVTVPILAHKYSCTLYVASGNSTCLHHKTKGAYSTLLISNNFRSVICFSNFLNKSAKSTKKESFPW